jgi:D-alanyl-lipoteichoic acid acyltransferase DltB (MBOAT superfamily)
MLFNSYIFIFVFLPVTYFIYFYLNKKRLTEVSKGFLVFSSLFFYSWWNIIYLPLILISMLFNYVLGKQLASIVYPEHIKKILLTIGVVSNLILLGYYKYADFFLENINMLLNTHLSLLHLALPLAISFFTFQQIAYLVDSYRGETKEYDFLNYAVFVAFFPQLIAGPIVHHSEMMPQFENIRNKVKNYRNIALGLFIFSMGLFKKVILADTFAVWATNGFDIAEKLNFVEAWITSLSYTLQLYFDFSGYTDMAIGTALLFNIKLPINFNSPYKAVSIQDFWRRWHMTLSRFLKDYVYIPLGGNRKGEIRTYTNLFTTFLLGGIWHGAGWTFVLWGAMHGIALVIHRAWQQLGFRMHTFLAWFITFNFINIAWVFFRAKEFDDAIKILKGMSGISGVTLPHVLSSKFFFLHQYGVEFGNFIGNIGGNSYTIIWVVFGLLIVFGLKNSMELLQNFKVSNITVWFSGILFIVAILSMNKISEFLYFNF